jgi:hypothetical protein
MRVEPNAAWKSRWLLTPTVSGSNPATRTKFFIMKYIIITLLSVVLFSCKTQKSTCDAYSINKVDTTYITPNHYHIESEYKCVWLDTAVRK